MGRFAVNHNQQLGNRRALMPRQCRKSQTAVQLRSTQRQLREVRCEVPVHDQSDGHPLCQYDLRHLPFDKSVSNEVRMTVNHHPKVAVHAVKSSSDPLTSQGARRATEEASGSVPPPQAASATNAEVVAHARRQQFSNADKCRILNAADRCTHSGEVGAPVLQEGVYLSSLSTWRRQLERGDLAALTTQKRGCRF